MTRKSLMVAIVLLANLARAEPGVTVLWEMPETNVDGTPITNLAGAKVYYGTVSSNYTHVVDVPGGVPGETRTFRLTQRERNLVPGVLYYIAGTAYNTAGLESDFCAEVSKTFQIEEMPRITIAETAPGEVWRRVIEIVDGVYKQRWEMVTP